MTALQDHYRVETASGGQFAVRRFGPDGTVTVAMSLSRMDAQRMRDELARAEARAFKHGLIIGHAEKLERPPARPRGRGRPQVTPGPF